MLLICLISTLYFSYKSLNHLIGKNIKLSPEKTVKLRIYEMCNKSFPDIALIWENLGFSPQTLLT